MSVTGLWPCLGNTDVKKQWFALILYTEKDSVL